MTGGKCAARQTRMLSVAVSMTACSALGSKCWQPAPNSGTLPKENSRGSRPCCFTTVTLLLPAK